MYFNLVFSVWNDRSAKFCFYQKDISLKFDFEKGYKTMSKYFRSDGQFIYLEYPQCEFYIPGYFFEEDSKFATDKGGIITTLGLFNVGFLDSNGNVKEKRILNIPTWIDLFIYDSREEVVDIVGEGEIPCKVITYYKGNKITNATFIADSANVKAFFNFISNAKIPKSIPYIDSIRIFEKNQHLNNTSLNVPSMILELILSVCYRDKTNLKNKFSTAITKNDGTTEYDYKMLNNRSITRYASTYVGITFEDITKMITTSLNRTMNKEEEEETPTEVVLKL